MLDSSLYPVPANEAQRLAALRRYAILDTPAEQSYDDFTQLASFICDTPIALISLIDEHRQWFKSRVGLEVEETPRELAFCAHAIIDTEVMEVEDARQDPRFTQNPLVTGGPFIRFYAGAPLMDSDGLALGTLCVIDREPRVLTAQQKLALQALSRQLVAQFEFRRVSEELSQALQNIKSLQGLLPICAYCKNVRDDQGYWESLEHYLSTQTDAMLSHGICPDCLRAHFPELADEVLGDTGR